MRVRVIQAYRFALDPSPEQETALRSHCGAQRFAYNWALAQVKANLGQRAAERSYGIPDEQLTPAVSWSAWRLRKEFNAVKDQVAPWWPGNSKEAYASGLANLAAALGNWAASRDGTRKGPRWGSRWSRASGQLPACGSAPGRSGWRRKTGGMCGCRGSA